ncbi:MAG: TatD family hydrolase [Candidatus Moranbacteria bacterium]|nr:TatD family hydrolase [Candidatus Moranbacteria bacterium]
MIDTHAHLDFPEFDKDREEVIARFFENGGKAIVNIGVDLETSEKSIELAENHEKIFAAVGFHPHRAGEKLSLPTNDDIEELKKLATHKKVKAIGEIGLDYFNYKDPEQIKQQKTLFKKQLKIADEAGLPVVMHCREAWNDLFEMIQSEKNIRFVLHCYSGEKKDTEKFLELPNVCFSFSGNITYPKPIERAEKLAEAVKMIPLERTMLDSDSPFLAPQQARGKRNEPSYVRYIAEKIAEIKEISIEKVEKTTDENANEFFGLD